MEVYKDEEAIEYFSNKLNYTISCTRLKNRITEQCDDYILLDVRHRDVYDKSRIPGAVFIDADNLDEYWKYFSKDKLNIVYCYGIFCHRGYVVCLEAAKRGYRVNDLLGNFDAWVNYPYDTES